MKIWCNKCKKYHEFTCWSDIDQFVNWGCSLDFHKIKKSNTETKRRTEMKLVNLCPHNIILNDGRSFETTGTVARVETTHTSPEGPFNIMQVRYGRITNLPEPQEGTLYIVSLIVLQAAKQQGRTDCVAPATGHPDVVRNEKGQIVSVPGFVS